MLRLPCGVLAVCVAASMSVAADEAKKEDKDAVVKALGLEGLKQEARGGSPTKPTEIADAEALAKAIPDEGVLARLKKEVDFKSQKLLYFSWAGSGGDKVEPKVGKGKDDAPEVVFAITRGRTYDLRIHQKLFAIPRDATWKIDGK